MAIIVYHFLFVTISAWLCLQDLLFPKNRSEKARKKRSPRGTRWYRYLAVDKADDGDPWLCELSARLSLRNSNYARLPRRMVSAVGGTRFLRAIIFGQTMLFHYTPWNSFGYRIGCIGPKALSTYAKRSMIREWRARLVRESLCSYKLHRPYQNSNWYEWNGNERRNDVQNDATPDAFPYRFPINSLDFSRRGAASCRIVLLAIRRNIRIFYYAARVEERGSRTYCLSLITERGSHPLSESIYLFVLLCLRYAANP